MRSRFIRAAALMRAAAIRASAQSISSSATRRNGLGFWRRIAIAIAAFVLSGFAGVLSAAPIVYQVTGTASGTIGSTSFTNAQVTVTMTGDTSKVASLSATCPTCAVNLGTATVTIAGVGTATVTDPVEIFSTGAPLSLDPSFPAVPAVVIAFAEGFPALNDPVGMAFALSNSLLGYDLRGSIGPITASPGGLGSDSCCIIHTTLGNLVFSQNFQPTGQSTFAASALPTASSRLAVYDVNTGILFLPAVQVGDAVFINVRLRNTGNFTFTLLEATQQVPAGMASVKYDAATGNVTIPAVLVAGTTYANVKLRLQGGAFVLAGADGIDAATISGVTNWFAALEATFATAVPGNGALRYSLADSCYLNDGETKPYLVGYWDANLQDQLARNAYRVGEKHVNLQIVGLRNITNPDSSTRTEVDVEYDTNYTDGSKAVGDVLTLITGSSAGSSGCASPQSSTDWRNYGNRQLVRTTLQPRNWRDERYSITTGAALSPAVNYRNDIRFFVTDPLGNATYVIVSGPGPTATVNGATLPFSLKLISPRLLRSAPELAGKNGNYLNWLDDDQFRFCRVTGNGLPVASIADCVGQGATGNAWGWTTATPNMAADTSFFGQGWVAGAAYTFDVYNDDGWKTINGQVGKTPIASYKAVLRKLPYRFVEMAGGGVTSDKFPRISFGALTPQQVQANIVSTTPGKINLTWNTIPALSDGTVFRDFQGWEFFQGPASTNAQGVAFPGYRLLVQNYPGSTATSLNNLQLTPKLSQMGSKTYSEISVFYLDRNDGIIFSLVSFN